jgi:hypothetical protein
MKKNVWLVPVLILIGTGLIFISIWAPQSQSSRQSSQNEMARVVEKMGDVTLMNNEMPDAVLLKVNTPLNAKDLIRTAENSDTSIQFSNEGQFHVSEKSEVLIDQLDNGHPLVVVRSGDIFIEKFGKEPSFWVREEGQLLSAIDFALSNKSKLSKLKDPVPSKSEQNQISQFEIENLLNSKKNDFFKCYGQVLQKNAQARGSVLLAFTILNQGQTSKVEVAKSDINESSFKSCLVEVVARTQFKAFSGPPVTTVFPLKFD